MNIEFYKHNISEEDITRVNTVLRSLFLTTASVTQEFEGAFANYLACENVITVSSCTAALHLALVALGIGEGDEVITTPLSFIATANAILHAGAKPVFVDVEPQTGNINIANIESAITPKTKAIVPVHLYGNMVDMRGIKNIADRYGLFIVEDAAHCIEGQRDGVRVGELGDMACFSFYATKNITSGEGGAISCHSQLLADRLKQLRLHGMSKDASSRYGSQYKHWDMVEMGWKYNLTDIQSALLVGQLEGIHQRQKRREEIAQHYMEAFSNANINFIAPPPNTFSAYHLFTLQVENRDEIIAKLNAKGIGVAVNYNPIHLTHFYRQTYGYQQGVFPCAEAIGEKTLSIPLYPKLTDSEVEYIINTVIEVITQ